MDVQRVLHGGVQPFHAVADGGTAGDSNSSVNYFCDFLRVCVCVCPGYMTGHPIFVCSAQASGTAQLPEAAQNFILNTMHPPRCEPLPACPRCCRQAPIGGERALSCWTFPSDEDADTRKLGCARLCNRACVSVSDIEPACHASSSVCRSGRTRSGPPRWTGRPVRLCVADRSLGYTTVYMFPMFNSFILGPKRSRMPSAR